MISSVLHPVAEHRNRPIDDLLMGRRNEHEECQEWPTTSNHLKYLCV